MTQNASPPTSAQPSPVPPAPAPIGARPLPVGRLVGVDLARGLAVFGMYAAHVGPDPSSGGVTGHVMELFHGRASALFAFLAGFSIILMTGRRVPKTGREGRQAVAKVLIRAVLLLALGTWLTSTGTPVEVILAYYGLCFVMVLPFHRLRAGALAAVAVAVATALVLPQLLYVIQRSIDHDGWAETFTRNDPLARISDTDGFVELLFNGSYPALTWIPFVLAGMAVARLDLSSTAVRVRLAVTAGALAVLGYGGSWLALHFVPGVSAALAAGGGEYDSGSVMSAWWSDTAGYPTGDSTAWLWVASPHSETTLSIVGNTGVAIAVLVGCIAAVDALPRFRRLAGPVIAVGTMSLTAYVLHVAGIRVLGIEELPGSPLHVLFGFFVAVTVFAVVWSRFFRRGPLERLMGDATKIARYVK